MIGLNLFRKAHSLDELTEALATYDQETAALTARQAELAVEIENTLALAAVGEADPKDLKALQAEAAGISGKLAGRAGARMKIARELQLAEANQAQAERRSKIAEARAWQREMNAATADVASTLTALGEKMEALRKLEVGMPAFIDQARPSTCAAPAGGWTVHMGHYIEPRWFERGINALEGDTRYLALILDGIERGEQSAREHATAMRRADMAPRPGLSA